MTRGNRARLAALTTAVLTLPLPDVPRMRPKQVRRALPDVRSVSYQ